MCLLVRLCKKSEDKGGWRGWKNIYIKNSDMIHYCFEEDQDTR